MKTKTQNLQIIQAWQGISIKRSKDAREILDAQEDLCERALDVIAVLDTPEALDQGEAFAKAYHAFLTLREHTMHPDIFTYPAHLEELQKDFYEKIHGVDSLLTDAQKLGFEFALGLVRYQLNAEMTLIFARDHHIPGAHNALMTARTMKDFFERLAYLSDQLVPIMDKISARYADPAEGQPTAWEASDSFLKAHPELERIAKTLISIQFTPDNPALLGFAQFMHWNGFGGSGRLFEGNARLEPLLIQKIQYHGDKEQTAENPNFASRMKIFGTAVKAVKDFGTKACIEGLKGRTGPIKIYGAGVGPTYGYERGIIDQLIADGKVVKATVSDVDGSSLSELFSDVHNDDSPLEEVRFEDLNLPPKMSESDYSRFDLCTVAIAMHQVSPDHQAAAIRGLVHKTKVGGYISIPDANKNVHWQFPLIPINVTDREGYPSPDMLFNFAELTVECQERPGFVKVPYPVRNACISTDTNVTPDHPREMGLYDHTFYTVLVMPVHKVPQLQALWNAGSYDAADQLASQYAHKDLERFQDFGYEPEV